MATNTCQCEHGSHFNDDAPASDHVYGAVDRTQDIVTIYGSFRVCNHCYGVGHMAAL